MRLRGDFEFSTASFCARYALAAFCKTGVVFLLVAPEMKSVRKNYVAKQIVLGIIADIERGIELEIACHIAGETNRRRVFGTALPIDLEPPPFVKVVGISKDCFVFVSGMNGANDHFVMLGIVARFDIRLRIYV